MRIRKRILSFLLAAAMLTAFLPPAGAADTSSIRGTISATMRIDYPQLLGELHERGVSVELFRNGSSLGKLPLTREASGVSLGGGTAAVSLRNTDGGALGGGQEPGYLDLAVGGLPQGSYELVFTGRGYVTFRQSVELDKYDRHIILGTGDATFSLGDVDGSGRVDETDRDLVTGALGSKEPGDLERYDLNGDGVIDVRDLACVSRSVLAKGGAELQETALLAPPVGIVRPLEGTSVEGDMFGIFREGGEPIKLRGETPQLQIILEEPVEMTEIQLRSPEGAGEALAGTFHVAMSDGTFDDISFDNTLPDGVHAVSAVPGSGVITISLGKRVAVKEITISVTKTDGGEYASVESIQFLKDIVPENPVQPNSEITNLRALPGDSQVSLTWGPLPNVSGYRVDYWLRDGGEKRSLLVDVPQAQVTGLDNLKTYLFTVTPIDKGWEGKPSRPVAAEPLPTKAPDAPDMVSVSALDSSLAVSWKASKAATFYEVYYKAESTAITGLTNDVPYSVYITAGNSIGVSGPSRISIGTPKATDYSRPAGLPAEGLLDSSKIADIRLADQGNFNAGAYSASAPFNARNMIDGDFQTHWTASNNWNRDEHVIVTFTEPVDLSAALWAPRMDGSYPSWLRAYSVRVWFKDDPSGAGVQIIPDPATGVSDSAGAAHSWPDVSNSSSVSTDRFAIMPLGQLKDVVKISVAAEQAGYNVVSCSELMFMEYDESRSLPDQIDALFTSPLCTELRTGVTQAEIDGLRQRLNGDERKYYLYPETLDDQLALVEELLTAGASSGSVLRGVESRSGEPDGKNYSQGGSDLQPLGAAAQAGDRIVVYAEGIPQGESLTLYASQFNAEANGWRASMGTLQNGRNVLTVPRSAVRTPPGAAACTSPTAAPVRRGSPSTSARR